MVDYLIEETSRWCNIIVLLLAARKQTYSEDKGKNVQQKKLKHLNFCPEETMSQHG